MGVATAWVLRSKSFFGSFFSKKEPLAFLEVGKALRVGPDWTPTAVKADVLFPAAAPEPPPPPPVPFVVDHPFIYIIRSNQSGDILFMGGGRPNANGGPTAPRNDGRSGKG